MSSNKGQPSSVGGRQVVVCARAAQLFGAIAAALRKLGECLVATAECLLQI
jgi:hypothetical protein